MRAGFHILFFCLFGCQKENEIQAPHFKELVGTWSTMFETEKQTIIVSNDGKITIRHSAERGKSFFVTEIYYGLNKIIVGQDTLQQYYCRNNNPKSPSVIVFYKKEMVDNAYSSTSEKIDNQSVVGGMSLFIKVK